MDKPFTTLGDLFERSTATFADQDLFGTKSKGTWRWTSYRDFKQQVDALRGALKTMGISKGDRVGIVSNNRVEWAVTAMACATLGAIYVPMYQAQELGEWVFILKDSTTKVVFVATAEIHEKLSEARSSLPDLKRVIGFDLPPDHADSFAKCLETGAETPTPVVACEPRDPAGFIYTSGTTGSPKGVILSHGNYCSNINAVRKLFGFSSGDRSLCFLPWAHSFGQTAELFMLVSYGASMALNDELPNLVSNLAEVQPTVLVAVPRIFNRIYDGVNKQMQDKPALIRRLFHAGIHNANRRTKGEDVGLLGELAISLADKLIFRKVRARFGGKLRFAISGSAALSPEVAEFVDALGIKVFEGYGLTETSPIVSTNYPGHCRIGSVGKPLPDVEVTIDKSTTGDAENGEIVVRGPNVMLGYHGRPEETAEVLKPDGKFHSGDLGRLDAEGFLYITGRIKEQYKLENGKYVVPSPLEETLKLSPYIANVMLYGANRPHNVALVVVDQSALERWAGEQGKPLGDPVTNPEVKDLIQSELSKHAGAFKGYERPKDFHLITEDFTLENDMLTPSLKLKRRNVLAKYEPTLKALYRGENRAGSSAASTA